MSDRVFYIISQTGKKALRCQRVLHEDYDYSVDLFVEKDGDVYRSEWKSLTKNDVSTFLKSGWDVSKENPLAAAALTD